MGVDVGGESDQPGQPGQGQRRHRGQDVLGRRHALQQVTHTGQHLPGYGQLRQQSSTQALAGGTSGGTSGGRAPPHCTGWSGCSIGNISPSCPGSTSQSCLGQTFLEPPLPLAELDENDAVRDVDKQEDGEEKEDVDDDEIERNSVADDALDVPTGPEGQHEDQAVNSREDPAGQQGHDDSAGGDDGVVLEGRGDVEEPVQGQHGGGHDGDQNDPEPNAHL